MELIIGSHPSSNSGTSAVSVGKLLSIAGPVITVMTGDQSPFSVRSTLWRAGPLDHAGVAEIFSPTANAAIARAKPRPAAIKE